MNTSEIENERRRLVRIVEEARSACEQIRYLNRLIVLRGGDVPETDEEYEELPEVKCAVKSCKHQFRKPQGIRIHLLSHKDLSDADRDQMFAKIKSGLGVQ